MNFLDNLTLKDIIELPPPIIVAIGIVWFIVKHGPPLARAAIEYLQSLRRTAESTIKFMDHTAPSMVHELGAVHERAVSRIETRIDSRTAEVKDHVTTQVAGLRDDLHDRRVDQIDAKIERIRQSNADLSDAVQKTRKG